MAALEEEHKDSPGFFVLQGVVTPNGRIIRRGLLRRPSSLRQLAAGVTPLVVDLVVSGGVRARNVVMVDHIELAPVGAMLTSLYAPLLAAPTPLRLCPADAAEAEEEAGRIAALAYGSVSDGGGEGRVGEEGARRLWTDSEGGSDGSAAEAEDAEAAGAAALGAAVEAAVPEGDGAARFDLEGDEDGDDGDGDGGGDGDGAAMWRTTEPRPSGEGAAGEPSSSGGGAGRAARERQHGVDRKSVV